MRERDAGSAAERQSPDSAPRDRALLMRRAIRAVAAAQSLVDRQRTLLAYRPSDAVPTARADDPLEVNPERATLHAAVAEYVGHLRDTGKPPERALIQLKGVLLETPTHELGPAERSRLLDQVVRWGIEAYYRAPKTGFARILNGDVERVIRDSLTTLAQSGLHALLAQLNARTRYRYTGAYCVETSLLRNVARFDRENPELRLGGDISRLTDTCCDIVARTRRAFATTNARLDHRLDAHAARHASVQSYQGAPIFSRHWRVWGTLCHFDSRPRLLIEEEVEVLTWVAASIPTSWLDLALCREDESQP